MERHAVKHFENTEAIWPGSDCFCVRAKGDVSTSLCMNSISDMTGIARNQPEELAGVRQGHPVMVLLSLNLGKLQEEIGKRPG